MNSTPSSDQERGIVSTDSWLTKLIKKIDKALSSRAATYVYMVGLLMYLIICGYFLIFSGSLFFEALSIGGHKPGAAEFDKTSFFLGYLYGFASLTGVIGGMMVLSTRAHRFVKFKILLFFPSALWTLQLVLINLKWGLQYWTQWLFLLPVLALCIFLLLCVVKEIKMPFSPSHI